MRKKTKIEFNECNDIPKPRKSFYSIVVKRLFDIVLSGVAIIILSPLFLVVFILELIIHGHPAIYKTKRPGKNGKLFKIYKFRSMTNEKGEDGHLLPEEQRLTKFGKFIRKTSIDELPQLFNIFMGSMSIVGPRPLLTEYLPLYSERHSYRHSVRPGLVCITNGDGPPTWRNQFETDIYYVEHVSFWLDVKMLFAVIKEVFKKSDYRTMDTRAPFDGTNLDDTRSKDEIDNLPHFDSLEDNTWKLY